MNNPANKSYAWIYLSSFENYEEIYIDGREEGNLLRFINDLKDHNVKSYYVPHKN